MAVLGVARGYLGAVGPSVLAWLTALVVRNYYVLVSQGCSLLQPGGLRAVWVRHVGAMPEVEACACSQMTGLGRRVWGGLQGHFKGLSCEAHRYVVTA